MNKKPLRSSIWVGGSALILLSAAIAHFFPKPSFLQGPDASSRVELSAPANEAGSAPGASTGIGWRLLQGLDYQKGVVPDDLAAHLGRPVRLPGFAVPLSHDSGAVDELLFVPNQLACIHVPAPPPHLVVYIKLRQGVPVEELDGPLWAEGVLALKNTQSVYGAAAFEMDGVGLRPYQ